MTSEPQVTLTEAEQVVLRALAQRQRESESLESRALSQLANRATIVSHVWIVGGGVIALIFCGIVFTLNLQHQVSQNATDIATLRTEVDALTKSHDQDSHDNEDIQILEGDISNLTKQVGDMRVQMEDKQDRPEK